MRLASGIVAVGYVVVAWFAVDAAAAFKLACIWSSDAIGEYTGPRLGRAAVTSASPVWMVAVGGWALLLPPLVLRLIWQMSRTA